MNQVVTAAAANTKAPTTTLAWKPATKSTAVSEPKIATPSALPIWRLALKVPDAVPANSDGAASIVAAVPAGIV